MTIWQTILDHEHRITKLERPANGGQKPRLNGLKWRLALAFTLLGASILANLEMKDAVTLARMIVWGIL